MNLDIFYVVGKRKVNMGSFEKAYISQTTPLKRLVNEKWIFDSLIQASFENFNLPVNIVRNKSLVFIYYFIKASLTEVEVLVNTNLRETSKVFKFKAKEYAKTQFVLRGNDVGLDMNTIKIPGDFVREILSEQENQQKSELE